MKLRDIDQFFWDKPEPTKSCLEALRRFVLGFDGDMTEAWKYSMPFYHHRGKRLCYIWIEKKTGRPYLGIVNGNLMQHSRLVAEKRSRMKIFILDPNEDLPIDTIKEILLLAIKLA
ncbi:DUF1801 domain-containing protein [Dyadobacter sp. CY323]|uniref:DUF1801 domain-containing protein n=1 Tax=Dyadobacter sp. CY323 TaxID=2907302 RepID=UPI001F386B64|nr:DUF1801 domain-containing protein [Dyadobacter sp. CY323]MCE6989395.1 DUF1801 domain-containing protein [Dyadobacter sp. CY323]